MTENPILSPLAVPPDEVARLLNVGRTTVYGLLDSGEIRSLKIGARRLVRIEEVAAFLRRREEEQASDRPSKAVDNAEIRQESVPCEPHVEVVSISAGQEPPKRRGPGRPKGSRNKPKIAMPEGSA